MYSFLSIFSFWPMLVLILSLVALSKSNRALREIAELKKGLSQNKAILTNTASTKAILIQKEESLSVETKEDSVSTVVADEKESEFVAWLKEDWLLKLGGTLVLVGILFLLSVAFTQIGPQGKIMLGYFIGACLMVFGFWFAKKYLIGGSAIHLVGAIVVIITTYVAQTPEYHMFDKFLAVLLMFLTSTVVALTAYAYNRPQLAHVGLVMASIVPILVHSDNGSFFDLLVYLCVVILGVLWLAIVTQWRTLVLWSQIILCFYSSSYAFNSMVLSSNEVLMIVVFGVIFFMTSLFSILRSKGQTAQVDGTIALLNAFYAFGWITAQMPHEWQAVTLAMIAFAYIIAFFSVYKITDVKTSFVIYGGVSLGMLIASVMIHLEGPAETMTLMLIASGATAGAYYLSGKENVAKVTALVNILPLYGVFMSIGKIEMYSSALNRAGYYAGVDIWKDFMVLFSALVIYTLLAIYFTSKVKDLQRVSGFVAAFLAVILVWQVLHTLILGNMATFVSLIIYTVVGLVILSRGVAVQSLSIVKAGRVVLGLVALRVLFIDAWTLGSTTLGIFVCIIIGILLLSSTLITRKLTVTA